MLTTLYLVRHANPKQNTGITYHIPPGPPLDETGRDEAHAAAFFLKTCDVQAIFTSPFERTRETAEIIANALGKIAVTENALAEHAPNETFDQVKMRTRDWLARVEDYERDVVAFVTHGSPIRALLQILSNETLDLSKYVFPNGNPAPTAGVWRAQKTEHGWELALVFEPQVTLA
jgi:2,3-bisphosphoglycerate-dependent phosphoglycerate mutase